MQAAILLDWLCKAVGQHFMVFCSPLCQLDLKYRLLLHHYSAINFTMGAEQLQCEHLNGFLGRISTEFPRFSTVTCMHQVLAFVIPPSEVLTQLSCCHTATLKSQAASLLFQDCDHNPWLAKCIYSVYNSLPVFYHVPQCATVYAVRSPNFSAQELRHISEL